ncbi:MAG: hypothetical protein M1826_002665 [Phylliscum demangeonii]|nr:MAG: hypothetical protein M1826_002665 [Phylliscum demangeonii]
MSMAKVPTDDYVADLLKRDAKDSKVGFSALGAFGALPVRPTTAAPKPNTRFLRNIIRETDSHNASLLLREDEQARLRLKGLKADGPSHGKSIAVQRVIATSHLEVNESEYVLTRPRSPGTRTTGSEMIDSHFSSKYDPAVDVQPNPESEDDWDQALEALRDRQRWKQQGADRLRAAGFTPQEVEKWETGGSEKRAEQVRWGKKGEGREWDRGKVVDEDGEVGIQPEWGRLKGP